MKKIVLFIIAIIASITLYTFGVEDYISTVMGSDHVKLNDEYLSDEDCMEKADYIVIGKVTQVNDPYLQTPIKMNEIHLDIKDVLYQEKELSDTITIIRETDMFTPFEKNSRYLLYIKERTHEVTHETVYEVCGGNVGMYKITKSRKHVNKKDTLQNYKDKVSQYIKENRIEAKN